MQVDLIDWMGTDLSIVNSARVSFNKQTSPDGNIVDKVNVDGENWNINLPILKQKDRRLLHYLARNGHWTPFGHTSITFRVTAPIFVRTQCFKHKQGLVENEVSRRYVDDPPEFWCPEQWRSRPTNAKQGSGDYLDDKDGGKATKDYEYAINKCLETYNYLLERGVAPEQARSVLPQSMYTSWFWTGSLAAFDRVCKLRLDSHAQQETGEIAQMINDYCKQLFPYSWVALQQ